MRRTSGRTEPRLAAVVGAVVGAVLAAGCAGMPDSGGIAKVELSQGSADKNLQVRVFPVEPTKGAKPQELLTGFLDALTADDSYDTARQYLTAAASASWRPEAGIKVLAANPGHPTVTVTDADTEKPIKVSGQLVSQIDDRHSFSLEPVAVLTSFDFNFLREKSGEWRIDQLPDGVIINESNFRNNYRQVDRFFYAAPDPSAPTAASATSRDVLIADPIYLRRRIDPLTEAAKAVVAGPSLWLAPVSRSAFPAGTVVDGVAVDESRTAHVTLGEVDLGAATACRRMATQLLYTLADQGKGQVERLDLKGRHGGPGCQASKGDEPETGPGSLAGTMASRQFYQRAEDGVLYETHGDTASEPVHGPLGKPQPSGRPLGAIAVARDGERAAALSADGHQLYTVPLSEATSAMPQAVLTTAARAGARTDDGLTSPTWDGRGDLFVVDRDPQGQRVLMVRDKQVVPVAVDDLGGRSLQAVKVSSDGVRIALLVKDGKDPKDGKDGRDQKLWLGLVVHGGTKEAPTVRITGLRPANPVLTEVTSVSWAEADQLLVLGKEKDRLQQLHYISTDGSQSADARLQGGEGMATVEASESRGGNQSPPPTLALQGTDGKLYRLVNNQWRELVLPYRAASFIYPG
ncbi:LpqB family beta-propeller domain-containing protein [Streptomyces sp. BE20]|uniref:LpqB family beta-propeller domain-containing protein n=1 Tax=Streptomyces sp. BE20 TaxID=3002525 RepID=UPI002E79C2C5|nr:LpqB family beta-propeller domain-containing protein [Streptomyces sp. BE20]MEE1827379.1 LpqB family beta-propeller domain-containing protein [Streptomyces sp. BE20]